MRVSSCTVLAALLTAGCSQKPAPTPTPVESLHKAGPSVSVSEPSPNQVAGGYLGFDRNIYPGDSAMASLRSGSAHFAFSGYWITPPPGARTNTWTGKRALLKQQGWGFLVLANGRLDAEILKAQKKSVAAAELGKQDAAKAVASAREEGFPANAIIFLDQEEGGRLLPEQADYLLAWTEAVAASNYKPGVYASGQLVEDDPGAVIDTVRDIRDRVKKGNLHNVAMFDAQDACPPAPGCSIQARPISEAGEPDLTVWQYAQSPRRPDITKACAATYAADGNCYAPGDRKFFLDMNIATSPDPSHGR